MLTKLSSKILCFALIVTIMVTINIILKIETSHRNYIESGVSMFWNSLKDESLLIKSDINGNSSHSSSIGFDERVQLDISAEEDFRTNDLTKAGKPSPKLVLLINSLGRGGSSWVSLIVSSFTDKTMNLFEPLRILQEVKIPLTEHSTFDVIDDLKNCIFRYNHVKYNGNLFRYVMNNCNSGICRNIRDIRKQCRESHVRLIKMIRMPLAYTDTFFRTPGYENMKIIYLARDPRAQISSRFKFFLRSNTDFNRECLRVTEDVDAFYWLGKNHPSRFFFLRYEDICMDPIGKATEMYRFLQGETELSLPHRTLDFIWRHDTAKNVQARESGFNTFRDSKIEWNSWRTEDNLERLLDLELVENQCSGAMEKLGYVPMKTYENLRNLTKDTVTKLNCSYWNCESFLPAN